MVFAEEAEYAVDFFKEVPGSLYALFAETFVFGQMDIYGPYDIENAAERSRCVKSSSIASVYPREAFSTAADRALSF